MKIIPASKRVGLGAFAVSAVAYSFGLGSAFETPSVQIEGAGDPAPAAIGSAFADMVEGVQEPVETEMEEIEEVEPDFAEHIEPDPVETPDPTPLPEVQPETVETEIVEADQIGIMVPVAVDAAIDGADAMAFTTAEDIQPTTVPVVAAPILSTIEPVETVSAEPVEVTPIVPEPVTVEPIPQEPEPPKVEEELVEDTLDPVEPQDLPEPVDTVEDDTSPQAPATSMRPKMPSPQERREAAERAQPKPKPVQKTQAAPKPVQQRTPQQQGNAQQNAKQGSASGTETGTAARTGAGGKTQQNGNAAMSNYGGKVVARIQRRKVSARGRGVARVSFSIGANGRLISASVSRSSGDPRLDKAALQSVQRASPFPKPPNGATFSSSIDIKGNG